MATQVLLPNATVASVNVGLVGGATAHAVLLDNSDATYVTFPNVSGAAPILVLDFDDFAVPAGSAIDLNTSTIDIRMSGGSGSSSLVNAQFSNVGSFAGNARDFLAPSSAGTVSYPLSSFAGMPALTQAGLNGARLYLTYSNGGIGILLLRVSITLSYYTMNTVTAPTPVNGATITTGQPGLSGSVTAPSTVVSGRFGRQWQFASDAGFSSSVVTISEATNSYLINKNLAATAINWPTPGLRVSQGTRYMRARVVDEAGYPSAWSATNTFTLTHVPSTGGFTPAAGTWVSYTATPRVDWTFSDIDPTDGQTKYQVLMWRSAAPGTILDSGLLTSTSKFHQFLTGISATWKDNELRWKVQVQDIDGVGSGYSAEQTFFMADPDVIAITAPAASSVITTPAPLVTWTNTLTSGRTQAQYKVDIIRAGVTVYTSGWIVSATPAHQVTSPVVTIGPSHTVTVTVVDSVGLTGTASNIFTANYASPTLPAVTIDQTNFATKGYMLVDWTGSTLDAAFYSWRVYRRQTGTQTWTRLFETVNANLRTFKDYFAPSLVSQDYAVVQVNVSFATFIESTYSPITVLGTQIKYILVCPDNDTYNLTLETVKADKFGDEVEMATTNLPGRGRRLEIGENFGAVGSLTASFRDNYLTGITARMQRIAFETLRASKLAVYLKKPQGDIFKIGMMTGTVTLVAGTGTHEYGEVDMDYSEIT